MSSKKKLSNEDHRTTAPEEEEGEGEEGTIAVHKKRSRRVSFAELTTLHVFDPDDDSEAPSDPPNVETNNNTNNNNNNNNNNKSNDEEEWDRFDRDLGLDKGDEDFGEDGDSDEGGYDFEAAGAFLRPDGGSPSTAGSTTTNDEDNYFGTISSSFIRPGRLSDSGTSDVHEMTMDSTAFSQHFRSLAKSDSGVDLETPTAAHLSFEDNTPNHNTFPSSNVGSSMVMNSGKEAITAYSTSVEKFSGGSHSNDMSLVENNPNKYDYGRLSFGWEEALLAEGVKELHTTDNISSPIRYPTSTSTDELKYSSDMLNKGMFSSREPDDSEISRETESNVNSSIAAKQKSGMHQLNGILPTKKSNASDMSPKAELHASSGIVENKESGIPHLNGLLSNKKPDCSEMSSKEDPHINSSSTENQASEIPPLDVSSQRLKESPLARSLPPLSKQSRTVFRGARASNTLPTSTSTPQNHVLSVTDRTKRWADTVPSVQKSISKLKILDASPLASDLNLKMKTVFIPSESPYRTPPCNTSLNRIVEDAEIKHVDVSAARENRYTDTMSNMKFNSVTISENLLDGSAKFGNSSAPRSREVLVREQSSALTRVKSLVSQLTWSGNLLTTEYLAGNKVATPGRESVFKKIALDHENIMKVATPGKAPLHPIEESVLRKSVSKRIRDDAVEEICRLQKDPKVQKGIGHEIEVLPGDHSKSNIDTSTSEDESRLRNWNDVLSEFLAKQMLPPLIDRLNLQAMGVLEDRMVKLQRSQTYDMHRDIIQSQRSVEDFANLHSKRTAEAKLLLQRLMHERAKLQLMRVKEEKLQRNVQLLRNGIQEAQLLKLNSLPQLRAKSTRDDKSNNNRGRDEEEAVPCDKITELQQLRDTLESKLMHLTKSVLSSCKSREMLSHTDTVSTVNDYLKKKEFCKYLRSGLQLYNVNKISTTKGNRSVVLNYLDFIIQRITFKAGSASSLSITNELNNDTISKSFANMDALAALSFVVNAIDTQKYVGSQTLAQVTQKTSSVLGNLVDVAEEVQQARFELQNLTYTRFISPSVGQLDLNLHFSGMESGRKLELTLDMSCLKWGLYPLDITAYKLEGSSVISRESLCEHFSTEIKAAIQCLDVGFSRILRICRTVSQVVQTWSR